ncbi:MAG: hypothetical protein L7H18_00575 [Candidatus Nealsonbacteria bacterium DGGOD1a]|jgi:hypothetical protein|nr:MAG: hypothetical protein L7H18_00575 [Candidatus Nealsonbacteria bacterium DGGOD1a]
MTEERSGLRNTYQEVKDEDRLERGLEKIIDGHLLIQREFPNPDHPESSCKEVVVIFETNRGIPVAVQVKLVEKYQKAGWQLKFGKDWRSGGPWVICNYLESDNRRMANTKKIMEGVGHRMSPWEKEQGGHKCKCTELGCELEIFFRKDQRPDQWIYWCGSSPVQRLLKCPCTEEDTIANL